MLARVADIRRADDWPKDYQTDIDKSFPADLHHARAARHAAQGGTRLPPFQEFARMDAESQSAGQALERLMQVFTGLEASGRSGNPGCNCGYWWTPGHGRPRGRIQARR